MENLSFFDKIGIVVGNFVETYGNGFAMMILAGFIIACIVELGVKQAFKYLEEKLGDKPYLQIIKMAVIFIVTIGGSIVSTILIMRSGLEIPGNKALAPFWFFVIYGAQYVFSMKGIKTILRIKDRPKTEKPPKEKKVSPVKGMEKLARNVYRDADGKLFDKEGKPV